MSDDHDFDADQSLLWYGNLAEAPQSRWLVKNLLHEGQLACVYGEPGAGKSFFAIDLAHHVATGDAWRGLRVKRGGVLYIANEDAAGVTDRLNAIKYQHGDGSDHPFAVWPDGLNLFLDRERVLRTVGAVADAMEIIKQVPLRLVVIDTLAASMAGGDENSARDMLEVIDICYSISRLTGASVLLVHHTSKGSVTPRGSGALIGAYATGIHVEAAETGHLATLRKLRNGRIGEAFPFRLTEVQIGHDEDGDALMSCTVDHSMTDDELRKKSRPLPKTAREGLDELLAVPAEQHVGHDGTGRIPKCHAVRLEDWRSACNAKWQGSGYERQYFSKAKGVLEERGEIGVREGFVWHVTWVEPDDQLASAHRVVEA